MTDQVLLDLLHDMLQRLDRIERRMNEPPAPPKKEWSPDEIAKKIGRAPFTVREWCRLNRVPSRSDAKGRRWIADAIAQKIVAYGGLPPAEDLAA